MSVSKNNFLLFIIGIIFFSSCAKKLPNNSDASHILVKQCQNYIGTPYKFGGSDKSGMDCSGLIYAAFTNLGEKIPRISYQQAEHFKEIKKTDLKIGDLVYFKVNSNRINHTGVISKIVKRDEIYFLHSSTSKGVREDNLHSSFWFPKFVKATRPQI
jgi:probable lipoprotein NlpC